MRSEIQSKYGRSAMVLVCDHHRTLSVPIVSDSVQSDRQVIARVRFASSNAFMKFLLHENIVNMLPNKSAAPPKAILFFSFSAILFQNQTIAWRRPLSITGRFANYISPIWIIWLISVDVRKSFQWKQIHTKTSPIAEKQCSIWISSLYSLGIHWIASILWH